MELYREVNAPAGYRFPDSPGGPIWELALAHFLNAERSTRMETTQVSKWNY